MTALTARQLAWIRSEIGDQPSDGDLQARFDRLESVRDVVIEVVRQRRNKLLETPLDVNLTGVASVNNTENVRAYERMLSALINLDDDPTDEPGEDSTGLPAARPFQQVQLTRSRGR